jgi:pre-rRNA-processing protein TSR3
VTLVHVIRHPKERVAKCSLRPLHGRADIAFRRATKGFRFDASGFVLLAVAAPELSDQDRGRPLLLLDSTWRHLPALERCIMGEPLRRSLPLGIKTAYPRTSKVFADPEGGLASVEALYAAMRLLGTDDPSLLDAYRWRDEFLAQFAP